MKFLELRFDPNRYIIGSWSSYGQSGLDSVTIIILSGLTNVTTVLYLFLPRVRVYQLGVNVANEEPY